LRNGEHGDQIKENEMGRVFSRNRDEKRVREAGCGSRQVPPAGSCEYRNERSGSMQGREFLDRDCELLKKE
jgi:hypothetical protein